METIDNIKVFRAVCKTCKEALTEFTTLEEAIGAKSSHLAKPKNRGHYVDIEEKVGLSSSHNPTISADIRNITVPLISGMENFLFLENKVTELILERSMAPRNCRLETYLPIKVPEFNINGKMIAYASPDSTYAVTKKFFDQAKSSILIGIYDLSAEHIITCIKDALNRGVKVSLMLDIDSPTEMDIFKELQNFGVEAVEAPACPNKQVQYFPCCHEKVIVIDKEWTLVQSGNYSKSSIPFNEIDGMPGNEFKPGNRDMGIAIQSIELANFFTTILRSDMELKPSIKRASALLENTLEAFDKAMGFVVPKPKMPPVLFKSKNFEISGGVKIQPVLSPDNYMTEIIPFLKSAKRSIYIEQQYIRASQTEIKKLLTAIKYAKENATGEFTVNIIVAPARGQKDKVKLKTEINILENMGFEVRLLSSAYFPHCHNKLILIDDKKVLISSQNWSDTAVAKNREAGVIIYNETIAQYYSEIFNLDWGISYAFEEETHLFETTIGLRAYQEIQEYIISPADLQNV